MLRPVPGKHIVNFIKPSHEEAAQNLAEIDNLLENSST